MFVLYKACIIIILSKFSLFSTLYSLKNGAMMQFFAKANGRASFCCHVVFPLKSWFHTF
jgi:hypothetical protein